jgi:hypothetical protein
MSTGNIISKEPTRSGGLIVTFAAASGPRRYEYGPAAAIAILSGADPKGYPATEVSGPGGGGSFLGELEEVAEEVAEVAEVAL